MARTTYCITTPVCDAAGAPGASPLYTAILGDAIARHKRLCGFDVAHLSGAAAYGNDGENSKSSSEGDRHLPSQRYFEKFAAALKIAGIQHSHFAHARSAEHVLAVQTLLRRTMHRSSSAIYKDKYEGRYCSRDHVDVSDSREPASCALCGRAADLINEDRYFFRLSAFHDKLLALYRYHPEFVQPPTFAEEVSGQVQKGLKDLAIGRKLGESGIPRPDEPEYWVFGSYGDLGIFLSGLGFGKDGHGSDDFRKYWPPNLQVIGKDALETYAVCWPAFLMAADLPVSRHIFAHGALRFEQQKADQSAAPLDALLQAPGCGDAVRYYLLREVAYGEDAHPSMEGFFDRKSKDIVDGLGNLTNRILTLVAGHCQGKIPKPSVLSLLRHFDPTIESALFDTIAEVRSLFDRFNFSDGLKTIWALIGTIDRFLTDQNSNDSAVGCDEGSHMANVLYDACEGLGWIAMLLYPVLPDCASAIWKSLGQSTALQDQLIDFEAPLSCVVPGVPIGRPPTLFEPDRVQEYP